MILNLHHEDPGGWISRQFPPLFPVHSWLKFPFYNKTWSFLGEGGAEISKKGSHLILAKTQLKAISVSAVKALGSSFNILSAVCRIPLRPNTDSELKTKPRQGLMKLSHSSRAVGPETST